MQQRLFYPITAPLKATPGLAVSSVLIRERENTTGQWCIANYNIIHVFKHPTTKLALANMTCPTHWQVKPRFANFLHKGRMATTLHHILLQGLNNVLIRIGTAMQKRYNIIALLAMVMRNTANILSIFYNILANNQNKLARFANILANIYNKFASCANILERLANMLSNFHNMLENSHNMLEKFHNMLEKLHNMLRNSHNMLWKYHNIFISHPNADIAQLYLIKLYKPRNTITRQRSS